MKIVVFNGSPRPDGYTKKLTESISSILHVASVDMDVVDIFNMPMRDCYHCDACKSNNGHCVADDVTDVLMDRIMESDMVVFASPVYWSSITGQLQILIDKMYSRDEAFHTVSKKVGILVVGDAPVDDPQYKAIQDRFTCMCDYLKWDISFFAPFCSEDI